MVGLYSTRAISTPRDLVSHCILCFTSRFDRSIICSKTDQHYCTVLWGKAVPNIEMRVYVAKDARWYCGKDVHSNLGSADSTMGVRIEESHKAVKSLENSSTGFTAVRLKRWARLRLIPTGSLFQQPHFPSIRYSRSGLLTR